MILHFQIDKVNGWMSPQVIPAEIQRMLRKQPIELALHNVTPEREKLLARLKQEFPWSQVNVTFPQRLAIENSLLYSEQIRNTEQPQQQPNANPTGPNAGPQQLPGGFNNSNVGQSRAVKTNSNGYRSRSRVIARGNREDQGAYQNDGRNYFPLNHPYPTSTTVLT